MARFLADKEVKRLIPTVIIDGDERLINPNGIELRLGRDVLFHSTGEEREIESGHFLKVAPGETVAISSIEIIDFSRDTVQNIFPNCMLMGLITPTTTMMREGIAQVSTKIDAGFKGRLNWSLRNGSTRDLILGYGESVFKLTIIALDESESPEVPYGAGANDHYQDTVSIMRSKRHLPADIPKHKLIGSSVEKLDPKQQLQQAGYPFNYIGTELTQLHGKFEIVSNDVRKIQEEVNKKIDEISSKIGQETRTLTNMINETKIAMLERVDYIFQAKFNKSIGIIIGGITTIVGVLGVLMDILELTHVAAFAVVVGVVIFLVTNVFTRQADRGAD